MYKREAIQSTICRSRAQRLRKTHSWFTTNPSSEQSVHEPYYLWHPSSSFVFFSDDVDQAYCQSKENLTRPIDIRPKQEDLHILGEEGDEALELQKPLYGLCDAGNYRGKPVSSNIKKQMEMIPTIADPSLYMKF